jgi:hypothetical protein
VLEFNSGQRPRQLFRRERLSRAVDPRGSRVGRTFFSLPIFSRREPGAPIALPIGAPFLKKGSVMHAIRNTSLRRLRQLGLALTTLLLAPAMPRATADDSVQFLGTAQLPGTATDRSGLTDQLEDGTPHNRLGGLSAIEYSGADDQYYVLSDRGPKDGSLRFACRWHTIELKLPQEGKHEGSVRLIGTTLLTAQDGKPYVGIASAFDPQGPDGNHRFDPEGLRRGPSGNIFLSDEYGPMIIEFDSSGHAVRSLPVPARYQIQHPSASKDEEIANNTSGRIANAGLEGLAITPDGKRLYALEQLPLLQDTKPGKTGKRQGLNCRLLEIDLKTDATREFVYRLEDHHNKTSEILAAGDGKFLVIERDGQTGEKAGFKRIMAIDIKDATDTTHVDKFPHKAVPKGVQPGKKTTFIDLLDPKFGLVGEKLPEKMEGLAWGPALPDGRDLLWVCVDNDFKSKAPNLFYAFAVRRSAAVTAK